jgi:hypothetical protein
MPAPPHPAYWRGCAQLNALHRHRERQPNASVPPGDRGPVEGRGRVPGKNQCLLCREAKVEDFYGFIEAEEANHSVVWLCRALKVSRASFYRWRNPAGPSPRAVWHEDLVSAVTGLYEKEEGRAGRIS